MTENTQRKAKPDNRHWTIAILTFLLVAGGVGYFVQPGAGLVPGILAGAIVWQIFKPRRVQ